MLFNLMCAKLYTEQRKEIYPDMPDMFGTSLQTQIIVNKRKTHTEFDCEPAGHKC